MNATEYKFDPSIICPTDPTATPERIAAYRGAYRFKYNVAREYLVSVRAGMDRWLQEYKARMTWEYHRSFRGDIVIKKP